MWAALENGESASTGHSGLRQRENFRRNKLQFVGDTMKAFRMAEEKISPGGQVFPKRVDNFEFRLPVEIDEDIAAENEVKRTGDGIGLSSEIEPLKPDDLSELVHGLDLALLGAKAFQKEPSLVVDRHATNF